MDGFCDIKAVGEVAKRSGSSTTLDNPKVKVCHMPALEP